MTGSRLTYTTAKTRNRKKNFIQYFNISLQTNDFNLGCFVQTQFLINVFFNEFKSVFRISDLSICFNMEGIEVKWLENWINISPFYTRFNTGLPTKDETIVRNSYRLFLYNHDSLQLVSLSDKKRLKKTEFYRGIVIFKELMVVFTGSSR